jgi:dihydropteroate synthase
MSSSPLHWQCVDRALDLRLPAVMGVLNVTADSFSDGGRFSRPEDALRQALRMVEEGAAIVDIGGESTRPGATPATLDEELRRVVPVIESLRRESRVFISVDTSKPEVMRAAIAAGADIINDVRALREAGALEAAARTRAGVCLMHMQGEPRSMQVAPHYDDVLREVGTFLADRIDACRAAGIVLARLAVDPGFGFGKNTSHNLELLRGLSRLKSLGLPILAGLSRKSLLARLTGRDVADRLAGSVALATVAVLNGARIVRAHDVAATLDAMKVAMSVVQGEAVDGT